MCTAFLKIWNMEYTIYNMKYDRMSKENIKMDLREIGLDVVD
jgi:hypothetical protein